MTSINISELTYSGIAEINMNDMSSIRGGKAKIGISYELLTYVPKLEAIEALVLTEDVLNEIDPMSFDNIRGLFGLIQVVPNDKGPITQSQIPIRRGLF